MARLSRRGRPGGRGQMLVVGALTIALLLVVLAFALNGAAVTETLATDLDGSHDARDATRFRAAAGGAVADLVVAQNAENDTSQAALSDAVDDWDRLAARGAAAEGAATEVTLTDTTHRFRAHQTNDTRAFTDANGSVNWTVAREVTTTRSFRMNLSGPALAGNCTGGCFQVVADNGSDTWRASFTANATAVTVTVDGPDGTTTCTAATNTTRVNLSGGRLDGAPCAPLDLTAALDGDYEVRYRRADLTQGTYELVVVNATVDEAHFADDEDPTLSPALHAATVSVAYRTERLTYGAEFRVLPGEDDA